MSFYRDPDLDLIDLSEYIIRNDTKTSVGDLLYQLYIEEITEDVFFKRYLKECCDNEFHINQTRAHQYIALVKRITHFLETGEDVVPLSL